MTRHKEIKKIIPGATKAVLFIHGIVGTPDHFKEFIPLVPDTWSIYNLLLKGHGNGVADFAKASMREWKEQVEDAISLLREKHNEIIIVAHSMGALFAIRSAVKNSNNIKHLFLMGVPLKIHLQPAAITTSFKILFDRISPSDEKTRHARDAYGIIPDKHLWKYISWLPRYAELFCEAYKTRKGISLLQVPCTAYQSKQDEVVSNLSLTYLKKASIDINILQESGHFYLSKSDKKFVLDHFQRLCNDL